MKKQFRALFAMVLIVVMLGIMITGCGEEKSTGTADTPKNQKVTILNVTDADYIKYTNNTSTITMSFVKDGDNWLYEADKEAEILQEMFAENVATFSVITGKLVEGTLEEYYLTEPMYTLEVRNADTTSIIHISENEEGICYAILDGTTEVYKIDSAVVSAMAFEISALQELTGDNMAGYFPVDEEYGDSDDVIIEDNLTDDMSDIAVEDDMAGDEVLDMPEDDTDAPDDSQDFEGEAGDETVTE